MDFDRFYTGEEAPETIEELIQWFRDADRRQTHGLADNDVFDEAGNLIQSRELERLNHIRSGYGKLVCHCRYIAYTMVDLLGDVRVPARQVEFITPNHIVGDERHSVFEFFWEGGWIHTDLDMGVMFKKEGEFLSPFDVYTLFYKDKITTDHVFRLCHNKKVSSHFPNSKLLKWILSSDRLVEKWYNTKMGAIMIGSDAFTYTDDLDNYFSLHEHTVASKEFKECFLTQGHFLQKYY